MSSFKEDRALAAEVAASLGRTAEDHALDALARFAELVRVWGARMNLTGARDARALAEVLFTDALVLCDAELLPPGSRVIDVGSGAGAPAIPLALLRPDVQLDLIEPLRKRVTFLRTAIGSLALGARVSVHERRLEGPPLPGVPFDVALSRATFEPQEWLARGLVLAPRVLVLTGIEALPEPTSGAELQTARAYRLPFGGTPRTVGLYALGA
jgi:16S rRNA (guanine527-N7)-methyltransferase